MTEISSEVRDLLVAIRDVLRVPYPADGNELRLRARLVEDRAACVRGALESVLDAGTVSASTAASVRRIVADEYPVTYRVDEWDDPDDHLDPVPVRSGDPVLVTDEGDGEPFTVVGRAVRVTDEGAVITANLVGGGRVETDLVGLGRDVEVLMAPASAFDMDALTAWIASSSSAGVEFADIAAAQDALSPFARGVETWSLARVATTTRRSA